MRPWTRAAWTPSTWTRSLGVLLAGSVALGTLVALSPPATRAASAAAPAKPNIVVVMLDDMRWDELRFAPNVQRYVTSRGISFANSFSPLPLCCPARATFLTGQYAHNHRVLSQLAPYGFGAFDDSRTLATSLRAAGYNTGMVGKYLNGYGRQPSKVTGRRSDTYKPAGWTDWMASIEGGRYPGGTYNYMSFTQNINGRVKLNRGKYSSDVIGEEARGLVTRYHASSKPFFLWLTPVAPHFGGPSEPRDPRNYRKANGFVQEFPTPYTPRWVRGRFDKAVTRAPGVPLRHGAEPDLADKPSWYAKYLENTPTEKLRLRDVERQRAESIYAWDVQFGKLVSTLWRTGEWASTVLVFTSDNGYYLGEHRHPAGKVEPHDVSLRVPLVVAGPGIQRGVRYAPAMTHDLSATILDLAGAQPPRPGDGTSLVPVLKGPDRAWDHPVVVEAWLPFLPRWRPGFAGGITEFGIRTAQYKYVRYSDGQEELYDLAADPNELTGQQRNPAYAEVKARLRTLWDQYAGCRAQACTAPLPPDLVADPAALRGLDGIARIQWETWYNR